MSFILDALRKSESERQRDAAPDLARIPIAQAPSRVPLWSWALIAALGAAALALGAAWWQTAQQQPASDVAQAVAPETTSPPRVVASAPTEVAPERDQTPAPAPALAPAPPPVAQSVSTPAIDVTPQAPVPTMNELLSRGANLPNLNLELLVFHEQPASRLVYINGGRYGVGQRLSSGPTVREIRPEGVVLSHDGIEFLLLPQ